MWTDWGVCETVLGVHDEALAFCRAVLDETMELFPSRYVHLGGDECPTVEWETSPTARRRAAELGLAAPAHLRGWFLGEVGRHLLAAGRVPICWAETDGATLPVEFTVMPWRDAEHGRDAARRGHDIVMAPHRATYLDYPQSDRPDEPLGQAEYVVDLPTAHAHQAAPRTGTRPNGPGCSAPRPSCGASSSPPPSTSTTSPTPGCAPSPTGPGTPTATTSGTSCPPSPRTAPAWPPSASTTPNANCSPPERAQDA